MLIEYKLLNFLDAAYIKSHEGDWTYKKINLPSGAVIPPPLPRFVWVVMDGKVLMVREPVEDV